MQKRGFGARDEVIEALALPQCGATPFLSCNSGGQGKEEPKSMWRGLAGVCLSEAEKVAGARGNRIKIPAYTMSL